MAWIKRNLFFVLSMAAGLVLTGYCAWLFYGDFKGNTAVKQECQDCEEQYDQLLTNNPSPTAKNVKLAKEDVAQLKGVLEDLRKTFPPLPVPTLLDDQKFSAYLEDTIFELRTKATNAEVGLPDNIAFGFTDQEHKLKFPRENILPWMRQLAQIKSICDILYRAKINSIASFRRVPVSSTDLILSQDDSFSAKITTNALKTATPFKFEFRCFTPSLAAVMEDLARSSNCFVVKVLVVNPSDIQLAAPPPIRLLPTTDTDQPADASGLPPLSSSGRTLGSRYGRSRGPGLRGLRPVGPPERGPVAPAGAPAFTVLSEQLLFVTLAVDMVEINGLAH